MAGARDAALRALIAFRRDGAWPESALKDALRGMDRREAALATRLCNGVLQNRMLLDHWLSGFVRGKLQAGLIRNLAAGDETPVLDLENLLLEGRSRPLHFLSDTPRLRLRAFYIYCIFS